LVADPFPDQTPSLKSQMPKNFSTSQVKSPAFQQNRKLANILVGPELPYEQPDLFCSETIK
jgi:hypothetical protein